MTPNPWLLPDTIPPPIAALASIGLTPGARVRFRRKPTAKWVEGRVVGREKDGSIGIYDGKGARAIRIEMVEVRTEGPRGGVVWEPALERAARFTLNPDTRKESA